MHKLMIHTTRSAETAWMVCLSVTGTVLKLLPSPPSYNYQSLHTIL